ncbi:unnamed protein product [Fusarium graminearum]|uniref:Uncharacterized protein n=1 Tax=Gibberella zeae TaxID=5518 RepID=A0A9N8NHB6_GIBZA|nr:unnamed protein product [Fusarium graminearum]
MYFDLYTRDIGSIIYTRYNLFLQVDPPPADYRRGNEIMTMYPTSDETPPASKVSTSNATLTSHEKLKLWRKKFADAGAMSIFCLPAIVDVTMLTFIGRGFFMTAFMDPDHLEVAGYALLVSMLLTAGVTGWVGSVGHYYMAHYAYDNMIYFHIQRLSGGFVLTLVIALCGLVSFSLQRSVSAGFVFVAYLICISTYFNILGVMSTMHLLEAPLTSRRKVILQTLPVLLLSPLISTFVNGHDLEIYLPTIYAFLLVILWHYRRLCQEWSDWMEKIPKFTSKDISEWYSMTVVNENQEAKVSGFMSSPLIRRVSEGMPFIEWLLKKTSAGKAPPPKFTTAWFTQLGEAINQQQQLRSGLKEHNSFILFRLARHDIGQNLALFLIALMDRWIMMAMSARQPYPSIYTDSRSRYGIWLSIVYFCLSAMIPDATLQKYWSHRYDTSHEKMSGLEDAERTERQVESRRRELLIKAASFFGCTTILLWLLVESTETTIIYFMYVFGYSSAIVFQFNRCFTTNISAHITVMMVSAAVSFIVGCLLHAIPATAGFLYTDVLAQNLAALLAAAGTSCAVAFTHDQDDNESIIVQKKITADYNEDIKIAVIAARDIVVTCKMQHGDGSRGADKLGKLLQNSLRDPNYHSRATQWSDRLLRRAEDMWQTQKVTVTASTSESFYRNGLDKAFSFSHFKSGVLHVVIGLFWRD